MLSMKGLFCVSSVFSGSAKRFAALMVVLALSLTRLGLPAEAAQPAILMEEEPHVGTEVVLIADPASVPSDAVIEWAISGDVKPVLLRAGGRECAFTPANTLPITVTAIVHDYSGASLGDAEMTLTPKEYAIEIVVASRDLVALWDATEKASVSEDALMTNRPIRLRAQLVPAFNGEASFSWTADPSTAVLSADGGADLLIARSEAGDSEVAVSAFNGAGVLLGSGSSTIGVTLPSSVLQESEEARQAWETWERAEEAWNAKDYAKAMELGAEAQAAAPRDQDIAKEFRAMTTKHSRFLRALDFRNKASGQIAKGLHDDALKSLRLAQVVWPTEEGTALIRKEEEEIDALRVKRQRAEWLRDTASAYDQEGLFEDAITYYEKSAAVLSSDAIQERTTRIRQRLELMADANRYASEGSAMERDDDIEGAIAHYSASIVSNPDTALKQHIEELRVVLERRKKQAAALYQEGQALAKKGDAKGALTRYLESRRVWDTEAAQKRIDELERVVSADSAPRGPEDFGIGTRADAARLARSADALYLNRRLEEAAPLYRKSLAIFPNEELKAWVERVEAILHDRRALQAANAKVREGNALLNAGKAAEAMARYREALAIHPNAEVEAFLARSGELPAQEDAATAPAGKGK
ncbi:hypothetical protein [uncultured Fretibacterium sp.]|uniref:hypothetical protein n=1 Tax=uncultured Fretibacterium sp. TaxID=1678694 RepID=UPI00261EC272|nr:hypothetical protein [uncultured Fretibacterium sp.]